MSRIKTLAARALRKLLGIATRSNTYSQAGEDAIMTFLFRSKKIKRPRYLELGTCDPIHGSNTYLFYQRGSSGVCVEADVALIDRIKKSRPRDTVLNVGIGLVESSEDFYVFDEPSLNTFDREEALSREAHGTYRIVRIVKVKVQTVESILTSYFERIPDILSVDLEGLDLPVLKSIDFKKYPIPVVCVETCYYSETHVKRKNKDILQYMQGQGYFAYADTYINTIFVNEAWFA